MGCCNSSPDKKQGAIIWYMPWKRRAVVAEEAVPPPSGFVSSTISGGGGAYEKTVTHSDMSSRTSHLSDDKMFICLWDHKPASKDELSVRQGEKVRVIGSQTGEAESEWVLVARNVLGEKRWSGYVPKAKVAMEGSLESQPWYFGPMTPKEAVDTLQNQPDGTYLVRKRKLHVVDGQKPNQNADDLECVGARKAQAEYALSIKHANRVIISRSIFQYTEAPFKNAFFLTRHNPFDTLPRLIEYMSMADSNFSLNKLPCSLKRCPPQKEPTRITPLHVPSNWKEIPRSQIQLGQIKGGGHFGVVYEAKWTPSEGETIIVAVKALRKGSARAKRKFLEEAATMKNLTHNHLVKMFGIVSENEPFWIITEFVKDGSLLSYLRKRKDSKQLIPEKTLINVCAQVSDAMQYLEEMKVVHRDLAARNVLVSEETPGLNPTLLTKVTDFGLAKLIDPKDATSTKKSPKDVPTKWTAPEVLQNVNSSSTASDVWSFGIVVHEIFSHGMEPYGILLHPAVRDYVMVKRQILRRHENVPEKVYEMMQKCFSFDPKQRPSFKQLHAFFSTYYK